MTSAVLLKDVVIWVRNISAGGCLVESTTPLPLGTIGVLDVKLDGARRVEWFRVCRVYTVHGDRGAFVFGAEFLPLAVAGADSLRGLVGRAVRGRSPGMPGLARRSSSDTGNSVARGEPGERPTRSPSTDFAQKVVDFSDGRPERPGGSAVAPTTARTRGARIAQKERQHEDVNGQPDLG